MASYKRTRWSENGSTPRPLESTHLSFIFLFLSDPFLFCFIFCLSKVLGSGAQRPEACRTGKQEEPRPCSHAIRESEYAGQPRAHRMPFFSLLHLEKRCTEKGRHLPRSPSKTQQSRLDSRSWVCAWQTYCKCSVEG